MQIGRARAGLSRFLPQNPANCSKGRRTQNMSLRRGRCMRCRQALTHAPACIRAHRMAAETPAAHHLAQPPTQRARCFQRPSLWRKPHLFPNAAISLHAFCCRCRRANRLQTRRGDEQQHTAGEHRGLEESLVAYGRAPGLPPQRLRLRPLAPIRVLCRVSLKAAAGLSRL